MKKTMGIILSVIIIGIISMFIRSEYRQISNNIEEEREKKMGILVASSSGLSKMNGLLYGLEEYGYPKEDLDIIIKDSKGDQARMEKYSRELVEEEVDVIVVTGALETRVIKEKTEDIPVVFIGVGCSVELGYVQDDISTGCNITGVDSHYVQLSGKRLEFLKRIVPGLEEVLILYNPEITPFGPSSEIFYEAARRLDVDLNIVAVDSKDMIISELKKNKDKVDGAMLMCNFLLDSSIDEIIETSLEEKIPVMGLNDNQVERGILGFYGSTNYNEGIQAARLVTNVLKGQKPESIPIESPKDLEFHLNLSTVKALGIDIEESDLFFVDKFVK